MPKSPQHHGDAEQEPAFGPAERVLLETQATALYEDAVSSRGIKADDPRLAEDAPERPAFELLLRLGLLSEDGDSYTYVPRDPTPIQSQIVTPLGQRGAELLGESSQWANTFGTLSQTWRRFPEAGQGSFTELRGIPHIQQFIDSAVADAVEELLTAQPQGHRKLSRQAFRAALDRELRMIDRGVSMRTMYQHSARRNNLTREHVREITRAGAEVRTLDEFFNRMIVIDRQLAIIPSAAGTEVAFAIRQPDLVAYLVDVFERVWERGRPFLTRDAHVDSQIAQEQRAMTIRMLIEGHPDPASAKRLGVSARTYAGYIADLKDEYDVETRFQLGYRMGRAGVTGEDPKHADPPPE